MNTISCIAIDDEPMALLVIESFCARKKGISLSTYSEPNIGMEKIKAEKPDLVFLDIEMNGVNGLDIAEELPKECCLIFTTAHAQYALEGFNLDAVDFLHKPFAYERFEIAIDKAIRRINNRKASSSRILVVKQQYNNVNIYMEDIIYVKALGNYCEIYRNKESCIISRTNLKTLRELLPEDSFLRIHRSYIVAKDKIEKFSKTQLKLKGCKELLPIGESYSYQFENFLKESLS